MVDQHFNGSSGYQHVENTRVKLTSVYIAGQDFGISENELKLIGAPVEVKIEVNGIPKFVTLVSVFQHIQMNVSKNNAQM